MSPYKQQSIQDILESDDEDVTPGPGQYFDAQISNFRPETKPHRLQFFGSTVERFTEQARNKQVTEELGPGHYNVTGTSAFKAGKMMNNPTMRKTRTNVGFSSGCNRFAGSKSAKNAAVKS